MTEKIEMGTGEETVRAAGHSPLTVDQLLARIIDHTAWGDFLYGYRYVSYCAPDGTIEGTNNVGSYNTGHWQADHDKGTFTVAFNQSWVPATLTAYDIDGKIHFFNQATSLWHMNMDRLEKGRQALVA